MIGLAAWRCTALISYERGPFNIFEHFRSLLGFRHDSQGKIISWPDSFLALMIHCPWCLGGYFAVAAWGLYQIAPAVIIVLSAWAILIAMEQNVHGPR